MKFLLFFSIASILTVSSVTADEDPWTGNDWIRFKGKDEKADQYFQGYVRGFILGKQHMSTFMNYFLEKGVIKLNKHPQEGFGYNLYVMHTYGFLCSSDSSNFNQYNAIVDKYIRNNPEKRHKGLFSLIDSALRESKIFNCTQSDYEEHKIQRYIK